MSNSTNAALSQPDCPVAALAKEARTLIDAFNRLDASLSETTGPKRAALRGSLNAVSGRIENAGSCASHLRAHSGAGMMYQLHLIKSLVDVMKGMAEADAPEAPILEDAAESIGRMLYSIRDEIERITGDNADDACAKFYMGRERNPFNLVETALAGMEA